MRFADIGTMSGASILIKQDMKITYGEQEILVGVLNVFSLFVSLASRKNVRLYWPHIQHRVHRIHVFVRYAFSMGLTPNYWFLLAGR